MTYIRDLFHSAHLITRFAARDIKARYRQTILGLGWAIAQPVCLMVVFTLVFNRIAKVPSDGSPYPLFAYSTLIFWTYFSTTIAQGTVAMTANASLVRKIYFPRETLLLSVFLSAGLDLMIAASILGCLLIYFRTPPTWEMLWVIPLLVLQIVFAFALTCLTACVQVRFRDIGHALPLLLQLWMFVTPVAYSVSIVPERLRGIYTMNPLASIMEGYRHAILHGGSPGLANFCLMFLVVLALAGVGYVVFKRAERTFADVI
jgi:lipopolysaccharide transport system permease protein